MIAVNANKNIDNYKKEFIAGFSLKETLSIFVGLIIGIVIITLLVMAGIPVIMCPYIAIPFIAIPIIPKFYRKNNMNFNSNRKRMAEIKKAKILKAISTENRNYYESFLEKEIDKKTQDEDFNKKIKKLFIAGIFFVVALITLLVTVIVIKTKM